MTSCADKKVDSKDSFEWTADRFDDVSILRYQVPGFDELSLEQKTMIYYLSEATIYGRDIMFDQNFKYNLAIRRTLEAIYLNYKGDRTNDEFKAVEEYLKKVWFSNGIHHHYSTLKFTPKFSEKYFDTLIAGIDESLLPQDFGSTEKLLAVIKPAIFDPTLYAKRVNLDPTSDLLTSSACNYYEGVSQAEAEKFYAQMTDHNDPTPISYGLNSKLVKENGKLVEKVWKIGGMYSPAMEKIADQIAKAQGFSSELQKPMMDILLRCYQDGNLRDFDAYNVLWAENVTDTVDFVTYFTETYGDPIGLKASWESIVNFKSLEATKRTEIISSNAQWFEDNSPINPKYRKETVKGVSAKVINAAMLGGDCYPATPIGINLPNADWIRRDHGSKSVTIENITHAYSQAAQGNGFSEEFILKPETREREVKYGDLGGNLHTDLHECLGHASGQLAPGVKGTELLNYSSTLEEARADLFALYYIYDQKLIDLGIVPSLEVGKSEYDGYMMNGMMTQLTRITLGEQVEEAHMRNRQLIAMWCYEKGKADNVVEKVVENGKTYIVINDYDKLRELFGQMLFEVQRIKSEGDYNACKELIETYAVKVDPELHKEVLERYAALNVKPYSGFVNPVYTPVIENGKIVDVKLDYTESYVDQMLRYAKDYSPLPSIN
ncbi:MAG: dihydrofolate reductase [Rikenellaceae bacterium]